MKTAAHTIRYVAKHCYQLGLMRGLHHCTIAGHYAVSFPNLGHVIVHGVTLGNGEIGTSQVRIAKSWLSL